MRFFVGAREFLWRQRTFGGSCLRYYAYREMIVVKMLFVDFLGVEVEQILGEALVLPLISVAKYLK